MPRDGTYRTEPRGRQHQWEAVAGFEPHANEDGVALVADAAEPGLIDVDPRRIRQVIGNLVSNGLRHTPAGGQVTVTVRPAGDLAELVVATPAPG